ncbi:DNA replication licensing factor Mcm6 [Artemisia annua]|uniref:DNA replication licensing factor Mcm6 n=1 Tax=Artemisia annua TaxID=35608 RepID=A0A2U1NN64_ARTAN|nr:DNA replication licensing factor Mcm6 [Artemisia annua]
MENEEDPLKKQQIISKLCILLTDVNGTNNGEKYIWFVEAMLDNHVFLYFMALLLFEEYVFHGLIRQRRSINAASPLPYANSPRSGSISKSLDVILRHDIVEQPMAGDRIVFTPIVVVMPDILALAAPVVRTECRTDGVVDNSHIIEIRGDDRVGENKVFVVVGKEMNESVLRWALRNSGGAQIGLLHVHQPGEKIRLSNPFFFFYPA